MAKPKKEDSPTKTRADISYSKALKNAQAKGWTIEKYITWANEGGLTIGKNAAVSGSVPDFKALAKSFIENRRGPSAKDNPHYTTAEQKVRAQGMIEYLTEKKYIK